MKIKTANLSPVKAAKKNNNHARRRLRRGAVLIAGGLILGFLIGFLPSQIAPVNIKESVNKFARSYGFAAFEHDIRLRHTYKRLPTYISRYFRGNDLPTIAVDIKFIDMQKLEAKRQAALRAKRLVTAEDDFVPAVLRANGQSIKASVRLKGDAIDHLDTAKWSMRVQVKGNEHIFGLRRFSLQHPKTRGFHSEVLFHEALERFDIITPQYFFVNVIVNGDRKGIMAVEEHFSKELLERNERRESVIIKLDESLFWAVQTFDKKTPFEVNPFYLYQNSTVAPFQANKIAKSPTLSRDLDQAAGLMRGFKSGSLPASKVFDAELLGSYLAVSELWGAWHEIRWENQRFYYNPMTMRLEPVAFDGNVQNRLPDDRGIVGEPIVNRMLSDAKVRDVYEATLQQLSDEVLNGPMLADFKEKEESILEALRSEFFMLEPFDFHEIHARVKSNKKKVGANGWVQPEGDLQAVPIYGHAFVVSNEFESYLELLNAVPLPIEVRSIFWRSISEGQLEFRPMESLDFPFSLPPTAVNSTPESVRIPFDESSQGLAPDGAKLIVVFGISGYEEPDEIKEYAAINMPAPLLIDPKPSSEKSDLLSRFEFLDLSDAEKRIFVRPGKWRIDEDLVIPSGFELSIGQGTTLQFAHDAKLIIYGPAKFEGSQKNPIVFEGIPGEDGEPGKREGILIHGADSRSNWENVVVRNTTGVVWGKRKLVGGVTFYRSDVDILSSVFERAHSEDALNIIHSDFLISDLKLNKTASDGIDADFSTGMVANSVFNEIGILGGGDAVDFSGSNATIDNVLFTNIYDKAISVGESSKLAVENVRLIDVSVGVASKDGSEVTIANSTIAGARYAGLMAYTKKSEYGPAVLSAEQVEISNSERQAQVQRGSTLALNSIKIPAQNIDVEGLYESVMRPGIEK